ncbi:leucine-rich repeat domain-containing protein [Acaryochloris sp. 'Moss Beach']|nr:COR domain-containing protein [Acaryochloris sp. 'Moss Beach']UJB68592.1 leucine-rich repeat domain-containing protein [Acaryochloris sp. 'Moss Beach']
MTQEELLKIIENAASKKLTELDLSGNGLTTLPPEIGKLTQLKSLILGKWDAKELRWLGNSLSELPAEIVQLTNLQQLYLSENSLSELPAEIVQLTNLQQLYLSENSLSELPAEIVQLTNLQQLYLSENSLSELPAEIVQLTNLQQLYLSENSLSELPAEIVQLTNLQQLYLSENSLSELPAEIVQLTNLQQLYLRSNSLSELPAEIVQLTNLQQLYLRYNSLSELPAEIGQLTNLQQLDLSYNSLSELPAEIGQLTNLQQLDLSSNSLSELPAEIGQLTNLQELDLEKNQLTSLPDEIDKLAQLSKVDLRGNSLPIPPEILGTWDEPNEPTQIFAFYRSLKIAQTVRLYEAKLLIIGEPGAGKTTLAKKIEDQNYQLQPNEESTEGIEVIQWRFPLNNGTTFQINIWDFGGQEIYHATHQFFLTKRSLYALVADSRREDTDFNYWLNVVELQSDNSPLLIIKNEKQDRKREINERQLRGEFTNLKETLATNLETQRGLPEVLSKIKKYISDLPHVGTPLPKTWVQVRQALEKDIRNHIPLSEYLTLCKKNGFTELEDKLQLSEYLHDLGVCLHFQKDALLKKTVILKPTWGTDAVYKVLDNSQVVSNLGHFSSQDLVNIWQEEKYATMRDELLQLMRNFKLCYEIPNCPGSYIAPQLLSPDQPDYDWDSSHNLMLRYEYEFMPKGILTLLLSRCMIGLIAKTAFGKVG